MIKYGVPAGYPEGYYVTFANIYRKFLAALEKVLKGEILQTEVKTFPGIDQGIQGVRFVEKCVESSQKGAVWIDL